MHIRICRPGYLVVDDMIDSWNIKTSCGYVRREKYRILGGLESSQASNLTEHRVE